MRIAVASMLAASTAFAQPASEPVPNEEPPTGAQSVLPGLLPTARGLSIDARVDYTDVGKDGGKTGNAYTYAQYASAGGFGAYAAASVWLARGDTSNFREDRSGLGNVEAGGLYVMATSARTDLLVRAGASVDVGSMDDQFVHTESMLLPRLGDAYATSTNTTWARSQVQVRHARNNTRLGAALGVDVPVVGDATDRFNFFTCLILSAGWQGGRVGLGGSVVILRASAADAGAADASTGLVLGGDVRITEALRAFVQVGHSLDDGVKGNSIGVGARSSFDL